MSAIKVRYGLDQGEVVGYPSEDTVSVLLLGADAPIELEADDPSLKLID